jgi:anti-sigma B factor antagonist
MHAPLKLRETKAGTACRLELAGELDLATAGQLRTAVSTLMGTGCRLIVVDLGDTTFVDSSGLGALVWAAHRLHAIGGELTVINPGEHVTKTLEVTGVARMLMADR